MPFTQTQLDTLEEAIVAGATSVSYEGKSVTYRSLDEMIRIRNMIRRALGLPGPARTALVNHDRAFPPIAGMGGPGGGDRE